MHESLLCSLVSPFEQGGSGAVDGLCGTTTESQASARALARRGLSRLAAGTRALPTVVHESSQRGLPLKVGYVLLDERRDEQGVHGFLLRLGALRRSYG